MRLYTEQFCAFISTLSMLFADLHSLHLVTFLMLFILVHVTFFSSKCMLELKFAIYHRAASLSSQASYAVLAEESWTRTGSSNTVCTPTVFLIQQSYVIMTKWFVAKWFVRVRTREEKWCRKGSHVLQWAVRTALWDFKPGIKWWAGALLSRKMLLFCVKTIVKESCKFELAHLKKMKKENISVVWWLSGSLL